MREYAREKLHEAGREFGNHSLLHVFGRLRFLVALQQRFIVLLGGLVVARELLELLLALRRALHPGVIARDGGLQPPLVVLERLELRIDLTQHTLDAQDRRIRQRDGDMRERRVA